MLNWVNQFNIFSFLDNHGYHYEQPAFDWLLATGTQSAVSASAEEMDKVRSFHEKNPGWLFGHLNYPSQKSDTAGFPEVFFYRPEMMLRCSGDTVEIISHSISPKEIFAAINISSSDWNTSKKITSPVKALCSKEDYINTVLRLKQHILRGDCYEINYCIDFLCEQAEINPLHLYLELSAVSPNPCAALYKVGSSYCLCASPERFLKKSGSMILSQPIKGTSKRNLLNEKEDAVSRDYLMNSLKEKSENVMIVDLVRNDLSRVCKQGTVQVKELFGVYQFPQVYQMISSITGEVSDNLHWTEMVEACFPMGSMTGAPKVKVMELIEKYEQSPRGLFSGTIGYVTPEGDFDFNVVIRSLFYHDSKKQLSFKVGSGITFSSEPETEYHECMLKASAIMNILGAA